MDQKTYWELAIEAKKRFDLEQNGSIKRMLAKDIYLCTEQSMAHILVDDNRQAVYELIMNDVTDYLDFTSETMMNAIKRYFDDMYQQTLTYEILPKCSGTQVGCVCKIFETCETYYVKVHQHGPTRYDCSNPRKVPEPDVKEMFIYDLLHRIGMGAHCHFIWSDDSPLYIATKEVIDFKPIGQISNPSNLQLNELLKVDFISRLLMLDDVSTSIDNVGMAGEKAYIVDFRIQEWASYVSINILQNYLDSDGYLKYIGPMKEIKNIDRDRKISVMHQSIGEWNILSNMKHSQDVTSDIMRRYNISRSESRIAVLSKYCDEVELTVVDMVHSNPARSPSSLSETY